MIQITIRSSPCPNLLFFLRLPVRSALKSGGVFYLAASSLFYDSHTLIHSKALLIASWYMILTETSQHVSSPQSSSQWFDPIHYGCSPPHDSPGILAPLLSFRQLGSFLLQHFILPPVWTALQLFTQICALFRSLVECHLL